jgi:hypothetical protein
VDKHIKNVDNCASVWIKNIIPQQTTHASIKKNPVYLGFGRKIIHIWRFAQKEAHSLWKTFSEKSGFLHSFQGRKSKVLYAIYGKNNGKETVYTCDFSKNWAYPLFHSPYY